MWFWHNNNHYGNTCFIIKIIFPRLCVLCSIFLPLFFSSHSFYLSLFPSISFLVRFVVLRPIVDFVVFIYSTGWNGHSFIFIWITKNLQPENCLTSYEPHGYCVIYSSADRDSFILAERILQTLWTSENIAQRAVILVGNKADLARSRTVTSEGEFACLLCKW